MTAAVEPRRVCVLGATGLVGRAVCQALLGDPLTASVHALVRRPVTGLGAGVVVEVIDFGAIDTEPLPAVDDVYCCLGSTVKDAGSKDAFRAIDYGLVMNLARRLRSAGAARFALVSAQGANPDSMLFYPRIKGELERDLGALGYVRLVIARPTLLVGTRAALGQRPRPVEGLLNRLMEPVAHFIPARLRPIGADAVARGMIAALHAGGPATTILESDWLQRYAGRVA